ncbi:MAG: DUF1501 domain-containing protein [Planctomycetes bacterium]|nr:DUF1501 domain-containing protein [Planctomycetota bacterium]
MLRILGNATKLCDGTTRRDVLQAGAIAAFGGLSLPRMLKAESESRLRSDAPAKAVILVNLLGGPSHLDMFDMKPEAPQEIRGEFQPIDTSVPGLQICEHLPRTARTMHLSSLIRTHSHLYNTHSPYNILTGYSGPVVNGNHFKPSDHPSIGSVMQHAGLRAADVPSYVWMPATPGHSQSKHRAGPYGGFLGHRYDPLFTVYDPKFRGSQQGKNVHSDPPVPFADPLLPALDSLPDVPLNRLDRRNSLLAQLDRGRANLDASGDAGNLSYFQQQAVSLLTSRKTRDAFDLSQEPADVRERYGRNLFGSCMLTARRLIEAGVKFVGVTTESQYDGYIGAGQWDTHSNNFKLLKNFNLPTLDRNYTALISDLEERGLLDSTLVVVMGEMGRTPKVKSNGGRDHWTQCGFILYTGGGVKRGNVFGQSDKHAAWPVDVPVSSADHVATIYHLLGLDPQMVIHDSSGRPYHIALDGKPVWGVIA